MQTLKVAGELDGGLTRANLMVAARSMEMTHPMCLDGIKFSLNGNADAYWIEGSDLSKYDAASSPGSRGADIIELSGKSRTRLGPGRRQLQVAETDPRVSPARTARADPSVRQPSRIPASTVRC
ncbi:MAG: hypothetical protein R2755_32955 [Acidimicrobiales bacterium]